MGIHFSHVLPCVLVCLLAFFVYVLPKRALLGLLCGPWLPPHHSSHDLFLFQDASLHFLPSSLWPLLPLLVVEFVLPVFRLISGVFRIFESYLVVFMGQREPRVLLLHHHLSIPFITLLRFASFSPSIGWPCWPNTLCYSLLGFLPPASTCPGIPHIVPASFIIGMKLSRASVGEK